MCSKEICFQLVSLDLFLEGGNQMTVVKLVSQCSPRSGKRGKTFNRRRNGKTIGKPFCLRVDPSFFTT